MNAFKYTCILLSSKARFDFPAAGDFKAFNPNSISDDETWADYTEEQYSTDIQTVSENDMEAVNEEMRLDELAHNIEKQEYIKILSSKNPSRHGPLEGHV